MFFSTVGTGQPGPGKGAGSAVGAGMASGICLGFSSAGQGLPAKIQAPTRQAGSNRRVIVSLLEDGLMRTGAGAGRRPVELCFVSRGTQVPLTGNEQERLIRGPLITAQPTEAGPSPGAQCPHRRGSRGKK